MRFWIGRNGPDRLCQITMWTALVLSVVDLFIRNGIANLIIHLVTLGLIGYAVFRMLSRNIYKRQKENRAFLGFWKRIGGWFRLTKNRIKDRKTHVYQKCPSCKRVLRLPRIKGKHTVCCPCCSNRFDMTV